MFSWLFSDEKRILELRQEVDILKREVRNLQLDWTDYEQRLRRRVASLARANQRATQLDELREETTGPGASDIPMGMSLTPRQMTVNAQILQRRGRRTNGQEE